MAPSPLYDAGGFVRERSSMVMDLGKLVLPKPNSSTIQRLKGKSVASIQQPVSFAMDNPVTLPPLVATSSPSNAGISKQLAPAPVINSGAAVSAPIIAASLEPLGISKLVRHSVPVSSTPTLQSIGNHTSWSKVVSTTTPQLSFMEPIFNNDCSTLCIPPELLEIGRKKYQLCLIGQFVGNAPKIGFIHTILNKLWGRDGSITVSAYQDGLFLFQFPNEAAYTRALSRGPWHVGGVPLMLWPWTSSFKKMDLTSAIFPVWIKLKHVPLELLTTEGLSYLASALGTPLHADQDCSKIFKSDCANICVRMDFSKPLLNELKLDINGENVIINVAYSWKPPLCDICKNWGHHALACTVKRTEKKWVQKTASVIPAHVTSTAEVEASLNAFIDASIIDKNLIPTTIHDALSTSQDPIPKSLESHVTDDPAVIAVHEVPKSVPLCSDPISSPHSKLEVLPSVSELPSDPAVIVVNKASKSIPLCSEPISSSQSKVEVLPSIFELPSVPSPKKTRNSPVKKPQQPVSCCCGNML
ncbi:hypothetical protein Tsubulata_043996 [Turnera subulata]|uniref:DUF4283 domain-containing protein n=1 Tax=Turnera subulata TaxID=218843 RepID=A0A9Q0EXV0_9ROSI|nr:hypothetical protein Tsubulata_043996 [Turnera subulata]